MKVVVFAGLLVVISCQCSWAQLKSQTRVLALMGSRFEITAVAQSDSLCNFGVEAAILEITRIEKLISSWDPASQTSEINRMAGVRPVRVDAELSNLILRSKKISDLTGGAFDISYASMDQLWKFDGSMKDLPSKEALLPAIALIDYRKIIIDSKEQTVFLPEKGMKIGFGAIGKGYAANQARKVMETEGISNGVVNAGGDLIAWGKQADGQDWQIGIVDPNSEDKLYAWLNINDLAVVTSGDYERFVVIDSIRYAHIIDPRTGYPVKGVKSVTVVSPDAEISDALATAVFVLGPEKGITLINKLNGIECLMVTDDNRMLFSHKLELHYYK